MKQKTEIWAHFNFSLVPIHLPNTEKKSNNKNQENDLTL